MLTKSHVLVMVEDLMSDFLYYNRKNDDIKMGEIETAIRNDVVTIPEILAVVQRELTDRVVQLAPTREEGLKWLRTQQ